MLCQWAEEKMSLACIMSDLLDMHVLQLDKNLQGLESELDVRRGGGGGAAPPRRAAPASLQPHTLLSFQYSDPLSVLPSTRGF
jgi:hypothetical protein